MEKKSNKLQNDEQLRIENQIRKIKLELEYGAKFGSVNSNSQSSLPPQIEKLFLDGIERFEKEHQKAKSIKIYDLVGQPEVRKADALSDSEIVFELEKINAVLNDHSIFLESIYEVNDRTFYTFIVNEFLELIIDDVQIPGYQQHFIYEDFHPNNEMDIQEICAEMISDLINDKEEIFNDFRRDNVVNEKQILDFVNSFDKFELNEFELDSLFIQESTAEVKYKIDFSGTIEGTGQEEKFSGLMRFTFHYEFDVWNIHKVLFPGMVVN